MYDFNYHQPATVEAAINCYSESEDPIYLAGGHTLIPSMKQRLRAPTDVIDLSQIPDLQSISTEGPTLKIGTLARHADVAQSAVVAATTPVLGRLASGIGDRQVRHRGTMGGSVANNDPAADYPAAVLGLNMTVKTSKRSIPADEFFVDMFETALEEGELLTGFSVPRVQSASYQKFANPASRYAMVGVMVAVVDGAVRVAITGAASCVFRATEMEDRLNESFDASTLDGVLCDASFNHDIHASAEYRQHLCTVMAKRAVAEING